MEIFCQFSYKTIGPLKLYTLPLRYTAVYYCNVIDKVWTFVALCIDCLWIPINPQVLNSFQGKIDGGKLLGFCIHW